MDEATIASATNLFIGNLSFQIDEAQVLLFFSFHVCISFFIHAVLFS